MTWHEYQTECAARLTRCSDSGNVNAVIADIEKTLEKQPPGDLSKFWSDVHSLYSAEVRSLSNSDMQFREALANASFVNLINNVERLLQKLAKK